MRAPIKPLLVLTLTLTLALAGCGGSDKEVVEQAPGATGCTPSGSGTTDLTKKPEVAKPTAPAPTETTITEIVCGTGAEAKDGSPVEVKYLGLLYADVKEFDSSWSRGNDETLPFTVGQGVIAGFTIGATGMKVGGRRLVTIPAKDGYGPNGSGPIPGGATLIFVIDLVKVS